MAYEALPSVKCSSCGQPVPLANLGDHVCPPPVLQKPPMSPKPFLPQRLHSLVTRSGTPPRRSSSAKPSEDGEHTLAPSSDPFQRLPPDKSNMVTPKATNVPFPKNSPPPPTLPLDRDRPRLPGAPTPPPERISTPVRDSVPPVLQRARRPSNANLTAPISPARAAFPIQFSEPPGHPVPRRPSPLSSARDNTPPPIPQPLAPPQSPFTDRASPNARPPSNIRPRPSFERARTPSTSRPSLDTSPSLDKLRPSLDARRPSADSQHPSMAQNPLAPLAASFPRPPRTAVPHPAPGTVPFPSSTPVLPLPISARRPPPPPLSLPYPRSMEQEIDTKIGGEAGMAGVGRRGFEAAARAAMFAASRSHQPPHITALGDSYRANVPRYLDTSATFDLVKQGMSFI